MAEYESRTNISFIGGGDSRQESVFKGLEALATRNPDYVIIHDAARPYCSEDLINRIIEKLLAGHEAVVPCVAPVDSVIVEGSYTDRNTISLVQTPQGFKFSTIYHLHQKHKNESFSDDASIYQAENKQITLIAGERQNTKITYREDIMMNSFKIGLGFDSHNFSDDISRKLILGGISIPNHKGLVGVSDADVVIHSLIDAILGAIGAGSIGEHFKEDDPKSQNANSLDFLATTNNLMLSKGFIISNIDITVICDTPKISDYSNLIKDKLSSILQIDPCSINIKGKTTEGTSTTGISVLSTTLLSKKIL